MSGTLIEQVDVARYWIRVEACRKFKGSSEVMVKVDRHHDDRLSEVNEQSIWEEIRTLGASHEHGKHHVSAAILDERLQWQKTLLDARALTLGPIGTEICRRTIVQCGCNLKRFATEVKRHPRSKLDFQEFRFEGTFIHRRLIVVYSRETHCTPPDTHQIKDGYHRGVNYVLQGITTIPVYLGELRDGGAWTGHPFW